MPSGLHASQTPDPHAIPISDGTGWLDYTVGYTPTTPANWGATVPVNVQQALDLLAAKVHPVS